MEGIDLIDKNATTICPRLFAITIQNKVDSDIVAMKCCVDGRIAFQVARHEPKHTLIEIQRT